jgi:hypothetical protein
MADDRPRLFARLAAERSRLLAELLGLSRQVLTEEGFLDAWTVKDLLAHVAAWDRWEHHQMKRMLVGEPPDDVAVDAFNTLVVAEWQDRSLPDVVSELRDARASWVAWLRDLSAEVFFASRPFGEWDWTFPNCLEIQWQHDAEHASQIAAWRRAHAFEGHIGPRTTLLATLGAAREELLTASALVPPDDRASRPVCGVWTLKDLLGHVADWEQVGLDGLRSMARGRPPDVEHIGDIDVWNHEHAEARRDQPWEEVWTDLRETREALVEVLERMTQADLARSYPFPWGPEGTAYQWVAVFVTHDREHAAGLREELGVPGA